MKWLKESLQILRWVGLPAFLALAASNIADQLLNTRLEALLLSDTGGGSELWVLAGLSLFNGLFFPLFVTACCLFGLLRHRGLQEDAPLFFGRTFQQLSIETLRSWGSALRWGLLLVVPGAIRLLQLIFVPFIVCTSKAYENGTQDALEASRRYFKKRSFKISILVFVFQMVLPLILTEVLDPWRTFEKTPLAALLCTVADLMVFVFFTQALYRIFESVRQEFNDEPVFQLERSQNPR